MECIRELNSDDETRVLEYSLPIGGEERHYEARLVGADGDKVLSIVRDVTEQRLAVENIRRSEGKWLQSTRQIRALAARLITAQESERRRISLLLHDDLSQNIAALSLSISRLKRKLPAISANLADELESMSKQTNDLTTQIRRLSHQLHPEVLEHVGLVTALESHVDEFCQEANIKVEFTAAIRSETLPADVSRCVYRVALEALRNVAKHSGALTASVSLAEDDESLILEVSDSGRGIDLEKARQGDGIGLVSIEQRIKLLQGSLAINTRPEGGTSLVARVPVTR
jgi:signal transduction histidine kinase